MTERIKAPIEDLLYFLEEKYNYQEKASSIEEIIQEHYEILTDITIKIINRNLIFQELCFCDTGKVKSASFPNIAGLLIKGYRKNKDVFGITYGDKTELKVWIVGANNLLSTEKFDPLLWDRWGAITALYEYDNYKTKSNINLGEREIKLGDVGKDVLILQQLLQQNGSSIKITGEYDEDTELFIRQYQKRLNIESTGLFNKNTLFLLDILCME